jgi:hypothetical protein
MTEERKRSIHDIGKKIEFSIEDCVFNCMNSLIEKYGSFDDKDYDLLVRYYRHYEKEAKKTNRVNNLK